VATRLNTTFEGAEEKQVEAFLVDVSALIRNEVPDLDTRLGTGEADPDFVRGVVFQVISRILSAAKDGTGVTTTTEQHPEYSYTITRALSQAAAEGLDLTDREIARLTGRNRRTGRAFSIIPG
jgi:hypothetical protein